MERRGGTHCRRFRVPDGIGDILFRLARTRAGGTRWSPDGLVRSNVNRRALHPTTALRLSDRLSDSLPCLSTGRSDKHTSELQSLMRISYAVFCLKKTNNIQCVTHY